MMNQHSFEMSAMHRVLRLDSPSPSLSAFLVIISGLFLGMSTVDPAAAQTLLPIQVYATYGSADTGPDGPVSILDVPGGGEQRVYLWATGGTAGAGAGEVCTQAGTGDALCGVSFKLSVTGGYQLSSFLPNPFFDSSDTRLPFRTRLVSTNEFVGHAFDLGVPTPVHRYLGELYLEANGANGDSQIVVTGSAIGADLSMREITAEAIVVPEPEATLMLGAGVLGLLACARRRHVTPLAYRPSELGSP